MNAGSTAGSLRREAGVPTPPARETPGRWVALPLAVALVHVAGAGRGFFPLDAARVLPDAAGHAPPVAFPPLAPLVWAALRAAGLADAPLAWHLLGVLVHLAAVALLARLAVDVAGRRAGLLAATLFAVHPLGTEAVALSSALGGVLAGALGLAALVAVRGLAGPVAARPGVVASLALAAALAGPQGTCLGAMAAGLAVRAAARGRARRRALVACAAAVGLLAMVVAGTGGRPRDVVAEGGLERDPPAHAAADGASPGLSAGAAVGDAPAPAVVAAEAEATDDTAPATPAGTDDARLAAAASGVSAAAPGSTRAPPAHGAGGAASGPRLSVGLVAARALARAVWPAVLVFDERADDVPAAPSRLAPALALAATVLAGALVLALRRRRDRVAWIWAGALFVVPLPPVLLGADGAAFAERALYPSLAGFALALSLALVAAGESLEARRWVARSDGRRGAAAAATAGLALALVAAVALPALAAARTVLRARAWQGPLSLHGDSLRFGRSPAASRAFALAALERAESDAALDVASRRRLGRVAAQELVRAERDCGRSSARAGATELARALLAAGDARSALGVLQEEARLHPTDPYPFELMGQAYEALKDSVRAEAAYRRALKLAPDSTTAANQLAIGLARRGKHAEAEQLFKQLAERRPLDAAPRLNLSENYRQWGRDEDADAALREARRLEGAPPAAASPRAGAGAEAPAAPPPRAPRPDGGR